MSIQPSPDATSKVQVDEVSLDLVLELPPELILRIFLYLDIDQVLRCILVSKRWYHSVCSLEAYFKGACATFGLSNITVSKERWRYTSYREMLIIARRQRLSLTAHPLPTVYLSLKPLPFNTHYQFNCSHGNLIARTLYKDFKPVQTVVEKVTSGSLTHLHILPPFANAISENRVIWACMNSSFLLCATASGIWTGYDLLTEPAPNFYRWRIDPLYESGLTIGCCAKCFLAVVGKVSLPHPINPKQKSELFWRLKVITLGRILDRAPRTIEWHVALQTQQTSRLAILLNGKKSIHVLPYLGNPGNHSNSSSFCRSHVIVHHLGDTVNSYILTLDPPTLSIHHPFQVPPISEDRRDTLALVVSHDSSLVAFLLGHQLYVSDVQSCVTQSAVTVDIGGLRYENMRLLALGHVYTVIGLEPYDTLLVVATHTGTVVSKYCNFATYSGSGPHHIEYLCVADTVWLDDISCLCSRDTPTILYWNRSTRCVEGLHLGQQRQNTPTSCPQPVKKKGWWRKR